MSNSSSKLLINESPLQVLPSLAVVLGNINEAIILQQIQYWLNRSKTTYQGKKWFYDSVEAWQKQFPWLSKTTINNRLHSLEKKGIIITANLNKRKFDRTKWYSINYDKLNELLVAITEKTKDKNKEIDKSNCNKVENGTSSKLQMQSQVNCNSHLQESCKPIPKTTKTTTKNYSKEYSSSSKKDEPHIQELENDFEIVWSKYPNKKGKKEAFNHYRKWRKESTKHTNSYLLKRLDLYKKDLKLNSWKQPMNGSTWFNGRFDDDYSTANLNNASKEDAATNQYDLKKLAAESAKNIKNLNDDELPF